MPKRNKIIGFIYENFAVKVSDHFYPMIPIGLENIPQEPVIFAPNHKTLLDAYLIEKALQDRDRRISWVYRVHGVV